MIAANLAQQGDQSCRRDSRYARCGAYRLWSGGAQLGPYFRRKAADLPIIEVLWQSQLFVAAKSADVRLLALKIACIAPIDGDLLYHPRREPGQFRPKAREPGKVNLLESQQIVHAATLTVRRNLDPRSGQLRWRSCQAA